MKKTVKNLLIAAFASGIAFTASAQLVPFTDVNFKAALLSSICADTNGDGVFDSDVDTNNDGKIQVSEALAVTGLIVDNKFINSLGGIQYFSNLQYLSCETN
ncbi:MAG: hypothetical protein RI894_1809, partial [Bacteroidota bacterium]